MRASTGILVPAVASAVTAGAETLSKFDLRKAQRFAHAWRAGRPATRRHPCLTDPAFIAAFKAELPITESINGQEVTIHYDDERVSAEARDADGALLPGVMAYWFVWYAFHPDTQIFTAASDQPPQSKPWRSTHMSAEYQVSLPLKTPDDAEAAAAEGLRSAQKQLGFVPNMYAAMANAPGVLTTYQHGYSCFRNESGLTPAEQEVVFLAISRDNGCTYCMAAHSMLADQMSKVPKDVLEAIRTDKPIADTRLAALYKMTQTMVRSRGLPANGHVQVFLDAGFSEQQLLYIVLAISVKTLSNYSNHLIHTPVDEMFSSFSWKAPA